MPPKAKAQFNTKDFLEFISSDILGNDLTTKQLKEYVTTLEEDDNMNKLKGFLSGLTTTKRASPAGTSSSTRTKTEDDYTPLIDDYKNIIIEEFPDQDDRLDGKSIDNPKVFCMWYVKTNEKKCCAKTDDLTFKDYIPLCGDCYKKKSKNKLYMELKKEKILDIPDKRSSPGKSSTKTSSSKTTKKSSPGTDVTTTPQSVKSSLRKKVEKTESESDSSDEEKPQKEAGPPPTKKKAVGKPKKAKNKLDSSSDDDN